MNKIKKIILIYLFINLNVYAQLCSPYYNPSKFYESPDYLKEIIKENLEDKKINFFGDKNIYKSLSFISNKNTYIKKDSVLKFKEYIYPLKNGLWKYEINNNRINTLSIARIELYRYSESEIADEINANFDGFWNDWREDAYEMQLVPQDTLFYYNKQYFSLSVFIYGFKGDSTKLKGTIVNYVFHDFTQEVKNFIECEGQKFKN